jgi:hypothetical protein
VFGPLREDSTGDPPSRSRGGHWRRWLLVLFLAVFSLTGSGHVQTIDAEQELSAAASLRAGHSVASYAAEGHRGGTAPGRHGRNYAAHDVGTTLLYLPLTLVPGTVRVVDGLACWPPGTRLCATVHDAAVPTRRLELLASFLNPVLGAVLLLVFAEVVVALGFDARVAVLTTLLVGFTSVLWVYAHISFDATADALFVLVAVLGLVRYQRSPDAPLRQLVLAGAGLGAAIVTRSDTIALLPALSIPALVAMWGQRRSLGTAARTALAWGLPVAAGLAANGWYNWYRFGSPTNNGNLHDPLLKLTTPLATGLLGQTVSPGKGMLFYTPLLVMALFGWPRFLRQHRVLGITVLLTIVSGLVFHAPLADWSGDEAWAARHTVPLTALALIPLAYVVRDLVRRRLARPMLVALGILAVVGLVVQLSGVLVDYRAVNIVKYGNGVVVPNDMRRFQAVDGLRALGRSIEGHDPYTGSSSDLLDPAPVPKLDLWWVRERTYGREPLLTVLGPLVLLLVALGAAWELRTSLMTKVEAVAPAEPVATGRR